MSSLGHRLYRAAEIEVDTAQRVLRRAGAATHLRARAFDLLVLLIENRHRVVSQQEILAALWPGTAVTPNSVMQCVNDVRRALNDDPRDPQFIRTVAKTGYQFIGPLEESGFAESVTSLEVVYEVEHTVTTRPRWLLPVAAGLLLLFAVAFYFYPRPAAVVAILPFENQAAAHEFNWLRDGLPSMLVTNLSRSPGLHILSRPAPNSTVNISGSFAKLGDKIRVTVLAHKSSGGALLASESFVADQPGDILTQIDTLALRLASTLGHPVPAQDRLAGLSTLMTGNIEAYRHYAEGLEKADALHPTEAIDHFKSAVALDPSFAMAQARVGYTYVVSWGELANAKPYLETAFRHSGRLTPRDRLYIVAWYALANQDFPAAIRALRDLLANDPNEVEAALRLASILSGEGRFPESIDIARKALILAPDSATGWNIISGIYNRNGMLKEAVQAAERYTALVPNEPNAWDTLAMAHQAVGQTAEAEQTYRRALALKSDFNLALIHLASLFYQQGRYREALSYCEQFLRGASTINEKSRAYSCIGHVQYRRGLLPEAHAAAASEKAVNPRAHFFAVLALDNGDPGPALDFLRVYSSVIERGRRTTPRLQLYFEGRVAIAQGRAAEGLSILKNCLTQTAPFYLPEWLEDSLALAYFQAGMFNEAIPEFQRVFTLYPVLARSRYLLAQAFERSARPAEARQHYERFLQDWKSADPDAPEILAARRALARL